jgi:dCMP deaminase
MSKPRKVPSWNDYFFNMAEHVKSKSKDRSTQVGVVVVSPTNHIITTGYNGFPHKINDNNEIYHERPLKYMITEHAERNAIYYAARKGISLEGCTMYFDSSPFPCSDCARAIIQSGIVKIIGRDVCFEGKGDWLNSLYYGKEMLIEAGVEIVLINENGDCVPINEAKQFKSNIV